MNLIRDLSAAPGRVHSSSFGLTSSTVSLARQTRPLGPSFAKNFQRNFASTTP